MELVYEGFECLPLDEGKIKLPTTVRSATLLLSLTCVSFFINQPTKVEDMRVVVEMEGDPHVKTWGGTWFDVSWRNALYVSS